MGLGQQAQVLRDLLLHSFVVVRHLIKREKSDEPLALGVLRDVEWHIHIDHPRQHPSHAALIVAHQPPVFEDGAGRGLRAGPGG